MVSKQEQVMMAHVRYVNIFQCKLIVNIKTLVNIINQCKLIVTIKKWVDIVAILAPSDSVDIAI